ncbi:MAG: TorF family putative porin [Ghiorsea sp.]|nr:TorF family putative porin [Ghiorsea sp.]
MNNKLKNYAMSLMLGMGLVGIAAPAQAADDMSVYADIGAFSQYIFRGAAQGLDASGNGTASLQGDVGIEHESGLSANVWFATGVNGAAGSGKETEFDFTVDYSGEAGDIGYSVGYIAYVYTDSTLDVNEFYIGGSYDIASATAYISDTYNYIELSAGDTVADMFDASVAVGVFSPDVGTSTTHITLGASKDFDMGSYTLSPSMTAGKAGDLGAEFAMGVNASF